MVDIKKCTFCGKELEPGTGRMVVKKDGTIQLFLFHQVPEQQQARPHPPSSQVDDEGCRDEGSHKGSKASEGCKASEGSEASEGAKAREEAVR